MKIEYRDKRFSRICFLASFVPIVGIYKYVSDFMPYIVSRYGEWAKILGVAGAIWIFSVMLWTVDLALPYKHKPRTPFYSPVTGCLLVWLFLVYFSTRDFRVLCVSGFLTLNLLFSCWFRRTANWVGDVLEAQFIKIFPPKPPS